MKYGKSLKEGFVSRCAAQGIVAESPVFLSGFAGKKMRPKTVAFR
jgi:hypothetical protein